MDEYDNLDTNNGNQVHDGWDAFDYNENSHGPSHLFEGSNLYQIFDVQGNREMIDSTLFN